MDRVLTGATARCASQEDINDDEMQNGMTLRPRCKHALLETIVVLFGLHEPKPTHGYGSTI